MALIDVVLLIAIGLGAGTLASSLGIGGGIIFVPALAIILGFDQHLAQGTSLAVILPTAIVGALGHAKARRIDWRVAIPAAMAGIVGGVAGARLALAMDPESLRRLFAVVQFLIAIRLSIRARKLYHQRPGQTAS